MVQACVAHAYRLGPRCRWSTLSLTKVMRSMSDFASDLGREVVDSCWLMSQGELNDPPISREPHSPAAAMLHFADDLTTKLSLTQDGQHRGPACWARMLTFSCCKRGSALGREEQAAIGRLASLALSSLACSGHGLASCQGWSCAEVGDGTNWAGSGVAGGAEG